MESHNLKVLLTLTDCNNWLSGVKKLGENGMNSSKYFRSTDIQVLNNAFVFIFKACLKNVHVFAQKCKKHRQKKTNSM